MVNEENLVATLEQSLRQTKNAQGRLMGRLREAEAEADNLRNEIEALENSAQKTKEAIDSILASMGSSNSSWKVSKKPQYEDDDYELEKESRRHNQITLRNQNNQNNQHNQNNKGNQNNKNNRNNSVAYLNDSRSNRYGNVSSINSNYEPKNNRFADRTITQACTLLLRDASEPLHVNELYNLLREGGFEFKGNNPTISIAVSLNRNRRFCKVAPGTFDLVMRNASQVAS